MTIAEFTKRHNPNNDPSFNTDLWSVIDKIGDDRFRQVAIEVLSNVPDTELKMYDRTINGYTDGVIEWGVKGKEDTSCIVTYSKVAGQSGSDWFYLLHDICSSSLRNNG